MHICHLLLLTFIFLLPSFSTNCQAVEAGTVIILNGPSASGKSSLQKSIQESFDEAYLKLGIDELFDQVLPDFINDIHPNGDFTEKDIRSISEIVVEGKPAVKLHIGPIGQRVISGMHYAIAAYAKRGNNVVVDYILYEEEWLKELHSSLSDLRVYFVGVKIPLETLEEREASRSTSPVGHARSHYFHVHGPDIYDLEVNTGELSSLEAANRIKTFIEDNPEPKAWDRLGVHLLKEKEKL